MHFENLPTLAGNNVAVSSRERVGLDADPEDNEITVRFGKK